MAGWLDERGKKGHENEREMEGEKDVGRGSPSDLHIVSPLITSCQVHSGLTYLSVSSRLHLLPTVTTVTDTVYCFYANT